MPPLDPEMIEPVHEHLRGKGIKLHLGDGVAGFEAAGEGGLMVKTQGGKAYPADLVILVRGGAAWGRGGAEGRVGGRAGQTCGTRSSYRFRLALLSMIYSACCSPSPTYFSACIGMQSDQKPPFMVL